MKYFNPSYWFKLWVLSAPLFNDKTQGINAKSIDNQNIKDWANNNTSLESIENQELTLSNNQTSLLNLSSLNTNLNTHNQHHKHRHQKSKNKHKRQILQDQETFQIFNTFQNEYLYAANDYFAHDNDRRNVFTWKNEETLGEEGKWKIERISEDEYYGLKCNILNVFQNEYLYAAADYFMNYGMRSVFTWREKGIKITNGVWRMQKFADQECFFHLTNDEKNHEALISRTVLFDYDRRVVSTIRSLGGKSGRWKLININGLYNIKKDFPDYNKDVVSLGIINDNLDQNIKEAIKQKYPNLQIVGMNLFEKSNYSHFTKSFSVKVFLSNPDIWCYYNDYGNLKTLFTYITKTKLNEISNLIANDSKVKQWIEHINDYNKNLPTKIEHLKSYKDSQKWSAKNIEKEIIKSYIRDWSYVHTLIEHDWKLDELNKNIQGLKTSFDIIKNNINELNSRVQNLENASNWDCANIVAFTAGAISIGAVITSGPAAIPVIAAIGSSVASMTSSACAIAGV